ncbi:hypothetical protein A9G09_07700 [Gilliamella sp. wkB292]|uniref:DUF1161 domain-containing protein n=1 Tax=Gilliamella sp. wkB292 TaxID=3120262 RepID=UPI00080D98DC|nr:DUF1161 domain-containing protein [Gilliamella apicola]OCG13646.1 hypothetical protein A9G09_07700 [Gilliamella apicola]
MKKLAFVLLVSLPMIASASNCDEISANIAEKIKNNGVEASQFQLKLVSSNEPQQQIEGQIVGSCDRGQQNIVYVRYDAASKSVKSTDKKAVDTKSQPEQSKTETVAPTTTAPVDSSEQQKTENQTSPNQTSESTTN